VSIAFSAMRSLVSYDDISLPQPGEALGLHISLSKPPLSKKRKRFDQKASQHWDDPGCPDEAMNYDEDIRVDASADVASDREADERDEESRELTYDEIWDDSALINAWNAATEEYEAHHGGKKDWKKESIDKSALWYNVPPSASRKKSKAPTRSIDADAECDSHPLNFDTFVPTHDPSLDLPVPPQPPPLHGPHYFAQYLPHPPGPPLSKDEAFNRALAAMYWGGYWTAVYHSQAYQEREISGQDEINEHDDTGIQKELSVD